MKQWWLQLAARIDALSLRERAILFATVIVGALALADVVWLTPAQNAHQLTLQQFDTQKTELIRLRTELQATAHTEDPSQAVRAEIAAADARLAQINEDIHAAAPAADKGPQLEEVLLQFLRRQEGLTLLGTGTLKQDATGPATTGAVTAGVSKRGMELRVSGAYGELIRYLKTLETALPRLRWGQLQLKSDTQPPELSLQVYVVGVQP